MASQLRLEYKPDTDGTGELAAFAQSGSFSGEASAWIEADRLVRFGTQLRNTFPIPPGERICLEGGDWEPGADPPRLQEVLLGLQVYPIGTTGAIAVHVALREGTWMDRRTESRAAVVLELMTDYQALRDFGASVILLVEAPGSVAVLHPQRV